MTTTTVNPSGFLIFFIVRYPSFASKYSSLPQNPSLLSCVFKATVSTLSHPVSASLDPPIQMDEAQQDLEVRTSDTT